MIPAALSGQLKLGLSDFLRMSFWSSTPGMETLIDRFVDTEGAVFKGPVPGTKSCRARTAAATPCATWSWTSCTASMARRQRIAPSSSTKRRT